MRFLCPGCGTILIRRKDGKEFVRKIKGINYLISYCDFNDKKYKCREVSKKVKPSDKERK